MQREYALHNILQLVRANNNVCYTTYIKSKIDSDAAICFKGNDTTMAVFAVLADQPRPELGRRIAELYPTESYKLTDSQWFISAEATPKTLAEQLGVREGKFGRAIVVRTSGSASGWYSRSVWEWFRQMKSDA